MYLGYRLTEELHCLLHHTIMIRRLKRDVQKQLPPKLRSKIPVECTRDEMHEIQELLQKNQLLTQHLSGN